MPIKVTDKLVLLNALNILQPTSLKQLQDWLDGEMKPSQVKDTLDFLFKNTLAIKLSDEEYVVSNKGLNALRPQLRKRRDVNRMYYLLNSKYKKG